MRLKICIAYTGLFKDISIFLEYVENLEIKLILHRWQNRGGFLPANTSIYGSIGLFSDLIVLLIVPFKFLRYVKDIKL